MFERQINQGYAPRLEEQQRALELRSSFESGLDAAAAELADAYWFQWFRKRKASIAGGQCCEALAALDA